VHEAEAAKLRRVKQEQEFYETLKIILYNMDENTNG
jgi:hypothetical protein